MALIGRPGLSWPQKAELWRRWKALDATNEPEAENAAATVEIFLPPVLFTVSGTPVLLRYRNDPQVKACARGNRRRRRRLGGTAYTVAPPHPGLADCSDSRLMYYRPRLSKGVPDQAGSRAAYGFQNLFI
jgi:hypothetical protein